MSVLAIVPARAGSRSVPDKNVASFRGRPLLVHSIEHGLAARNVDRVLVSTDSPRYRAIAQAAGAEAPFLRPAALAQDLSTDLEVFCHALEWLERHEGYRPEVCVHLRPTCPTRKVSDVEQAVDLLLANPAADSVRSVVKAPHTPYKMWRLDDTGLLRPLLAGPVPEAWNRPRQILPDAYLQNAAVDVVRARVVRECRSMTGGRILPYLMSRLADVDEWADLARLEASYPAGELPTGRTFVFDLDGVIATLVPDGDYRQAEASRPAVAVVNRLHDAGNRIVIHTARGSETGRDWSADTREQLRRWGVRHDQLCFGKPAADFYVDDRAVPLATLVAWVESCGRQGGRERV
jgi:CMP-N,N'-diacetyllegionaminic acid synthase